MSDPVAPLSLPPLCGEIRHAFDSMASKGRVTLDASLREHTDSCRDCWRALVDLRWKLAGSSRDVSELREYLGAAFEWGVDSSWLLVEDWHSSERESADGVHAFYKATKWYIYNLVLWEASGQRPPYVQAASPLLARHNVRSVLDFGAGVGTDSLKFRDRGLSVIASDFDNDASRFLRWRAAQRGSEVRFVSAEALGSTFFKVDMIWALDVIEHLPRPVETLTRLLPSADLFVYDSEHVGHSSGRHPFHFQHDQPSLERAWNQQGFARDERCSAESGLEVFARSVCRPEQP